MASLRILCLLFIAVLAASDSEDTTQTTVCDVCRCDGPRVDCREKSLSSLPDIYQKTASTFDFSYNNLTKIEVLPPSSNVTHLLFAHNHISSIANEAFFNQSNLQVLDLSHNELGSADLLPGIFRGPYDFDSSHPTLNILILKLSGNHIHSLNDDLFDSLIYLEELHLDSNPITQIDHQTLVAISNLHQMKVLNLSSTGLSKIPESMLYTPRKLEVLDLSSNAFKTVPPTLQDSSSLRDIILDGNHFLTLDYFPKVVALRSVHLSYMPQLQSIGDYALSNLTNLEEFICTSNPYLHNISDKAFQQAITEENPHVTYIPLKRLYLSDNRLSYINEELFARWDLLDELNLDANPWSCDCNNQWFLVHLIEKMNITHKNVENLICALPEQMKNKKMVDLVRANEHLRCLDYFGNHPEKDEKVLIFMLLATLFAVPLALIVVGYLKRPRSIGSYPNAVYKKAESDFTVNSY